MNSLEKIGKKIRKNHSKEKIVLIGGSFDLIHIGHTRVLEKAKKHGDVLVVALNSDAHIKTYKPTHRPIVPETQRAEVVGSIKHVDYVFITDEGLYDPNIYKSLQPDILILIKEKGRYKSRVASAMKLMSQFPKLEVVFANRLYGNISTTQIEQKVLSQLGNSVKAK